MLRTAKMELLRALVSERLSAVAQEIFKIVESTIIEYEEEMSCSKWVVDSHGRLLDVANSYSEGQLKRDKTYVVERAGHDEHQMISGPGVEPAISATRTVASVHGGPALPTEPNQRPVKDSLQVCDTDVKLQSGQQLRPEPENTIEPALDCLNINNIHPDSSPASENDHPSDQEILSDEDDDVKQESDLNSPSKIHKLKKQIKCPVCFSVFSSKKTMVQHFKTHPEDKSLSYQCQFCPHRFCKKSEFITHTWTHQSGKPYKHQSQGDSRLSHRQKLTDGKPYQCFSESDIKIYPLNIPPYDKSEFEQESLQPLCLYQIQTVADIDKDSTAAAPGNRIKTEPVETDCGVSECTIGDLQLHSVNPGDQRETEPKHFSLKDILQRRPVVKSMVHIEAGTAQKPYKCPCCTKCFSLRKTLIRHLKIHAEDKPYQCQLCGRNFCQNSDLVNHIRIHTGERPYQCPECHKSFAQKGNLSVHMRKHTGEKPYQCRVQLQL